MRLVSLFRLGQPEQDVPLLTGSALSQLPITRGLGAFVGEVLPPAADLSAGTSRGRAHLHIMATSSSLESVVR
jgi:hypothetical protein